jgi:hypothetical protein
MKVLKCTIDAHRKQFGTDMQCLKYLADNKWSAGYKCRKCEHNVYVKGRIHLDRKCQKCSHNESPTSGTMFHGMKLNLSKVFEIIYRIAVNKKGLSCISIAREFGMNQKSATLLRSKIQISMASSESYAITDNVHVDEFFVGGPDAEKQGRSSDTKKKKAVIAVEVLANGKGIGRAYALQIKNFSGKELIKVFEKHIDKGAKITTDKWTGYTPIKQDYEKLIQIKSEKGKNFPELHIVIMNL